MAVPTPRAVTDADAEGLIALVGDAYAEHPGCVLDLPGVDADLVAPGTMAARNGGRWWVFEDAGQVVASVGSGPLRPDSLVELKRLYVARAHRRRGIASALVDRVLAQASGLGARGLDLWSDTRFAAAHRLYATLGFDRTDETRRLDDPSDTTEVRFVRPLIARAPDAVVSWHGPTGTDVCHLVELPDGRLLRGAGRVGYRVEVDGAWRSRAAALGGPAGTQRVTSDGAGRWWRQGRRDRTLDGCLDADVEPSPATLTLPLLRAGGGGPVITSLASLPATGGGPRPRRRDLTRLDDARWSVRTEGADIELVVADDGLAARYERWWRT